MADISSPDNRFRFKIEGMDCGGCVATIRTALEGMPGATDVEVSLPRQELLVTLPDGDTSAADIRRVMGRLGFGAECLSHPDKDRPRRKGWLQGKPAQLALAAGAIVAAHAVSFPFPNAERLAFSIAALVTLIPIALRAIAAARMGAIFTIQMLMTIAALGAIIIGEPTEAAFVVLLFILGEMLEGRATRQAQSGIKALAEMLPRHALVQDASGNLNKIATEDLQIGQQIIVRAGDRIAADGVIASGSSAVDESTITGESIPVAKSPGDRVSAGTINHDATLRISVDRDSADNTISRIIALVEEAQAAKAPTERFIDRFSRIYMPIVIAVSALVAITPPLFLGLAWDDWIYRGLALLLIGCPCALVISVPAAIAASLAASARRGMLIKGGAVLETLAHSNRVVFDKTGTLTSGKPVVTDFIDLSAGSYDTLAIAAAVERESSHPLAMAVVAHADQQGVNRLDAREVTILPGQGMRAVVGVMQIYVGAPDHAPLQGKADADAETQMSRLKAEGKTLSVICADGVVIGLIALRDEARPEAAKAVQALKAQGMSSLMLTGDNEGTARALATPLGMAFQSGMLPQDKAGIVAAMAQSDIVTMVGDGVNDAPALAAAQVGVAIGSGTDVAMEAADAVLMSNQIGDLPRMIAKARATMRVIRQNVAIALGLKLVFLITTIAGLTGLWPAIMADTGATVLVTLNSMRLLRDSGRDIATPTVTR
ncbi:heavy metal translocating P-type ATPase [Paracoccus seriniphilus]|uniref:heavy metal translocating P-type ATPase n=1 Tax=Paracoccus seriniphilus TaxID=184748 RepID=UPI0035641C41